MAMSACAVFFVAAFFLGSEAQSDFGKLPESFKKGVELAVEQVNSHSGLQHHFLFFKSIEKSSIEAGFEVTYIYHNFYLKATKCSRGITKADPKKCAFRNDRPLIDCGICYKLYAGEIEKEPKPYIHCVHKPAMTEEMKKTRLEHCNDGAYGNGASTLLASTGTQK
uniref:Retinoic acid receptor responder protein 2 n=1 Tax=Pygocentrus nattereri TaxID=42514 RepID=A0A3B4D2E3_PYGNA